MSLPERNVAPSAARLHARHQLLACRSSMPPAIFSATAPVSAVRLHVAGKKGREARGGLQGWQRDGCKNPSVYALVDAAPDRLLCMSLYMHVCMHGLMQCMSSGSSPTHKGLQPSEESIPRNSLRLYSHSHHLRHGMYEDLAVTNLPRVRGSSHDANHGIHLGAAWVVRERMHGEGDQGQVNVDMVSMHAAGMHASSSAIHTQATHAHEGVEAICYTRTRYTEHVELHSCAEQKGCCYTACTSSHASLVMYTRCLCIISLHTCILLDIFPLTV